MTLTLVILAALFVVAIVFSSSEFRYGLSRDRGGFVLLGFPTLAAAWPVIAIAIGYVMRSSGNSLTTEQLYLIQFAPLLGLCILITPWALFRSRKVVLVPSLLLAMVLAVIAVFAYAVGQSWLHVLFATLALGPALAVYKDPERLEVLRRGIVLAVVILVVFLAIFAMSVPSLAVRACDRELKCMLTDGLLTVDHGPGSNVVGVTLALIAPAAIVAFKGWRGWVLTVPILLVVTLSGSRTAMVALAVAATCTLLLRINWIGRRPWLALGPLAIVSLIPVFWHFDRLAFTERGYLWSVAQRLVGESPWLGKGVSYWVRDSGTWNGGVSSYSPHNIWLALMVDIGIIGTVAVVGALLIAFLFASASGRGLAFPLIFSMLSAGVLEATVLPHRLGPFPGGFLLLVLVLAISQPGEFQGARWWNQLTRARLRNHGEPSAAPDRADILA